MTGSQIGGIVMICILFGWIPILAIGHAISSIIKAFRHTTDITVDNITVNVETIENLDEDIIDKIVLNNINKTTI